MWEARLHLTAKSQGLVAYLLMHMGVGGKGDSKDTKEGAQWDEKESRRAEISKRTKPTISGEPQRDRNPGKNPVTRVGGLRGRICSRLGTHRGQWWFFSSGDPLH